jgi:hypothetical protein
MDKKRIGPLALAIVIITGMTGGYALAKERGDEARVVQALLNSKISLSQAITTAEQQSGSKAIGAGVDDENSTVRIVVEVASNQGAAGGPGGLECAQGDYGALVGGRWQCGNMLADALDPARPIQGRGQCREP